MDTKLWMLHVQGPDDVVAAPSKEEADAVAAAFNAFYGAYLAKQRAASVAAGQDPDNWPTINAVVVEWDSTVKAHAKSVAKYWPEYREYLGVDAALALRESGKRGSAAGLRETGQIVRTDSFDNTDGARLMSPSVPDDASLNAGEIVSSHPRSHDESDGGQH